MADFHFYLAGCEAWAAPEKAVYLPEHQALLVSDLHFGKAAHFRKHGIGVPAQADFDNLARLDALIERFAPQRLVLTGDAFHSTENVSLLLFKSWRERYAGLSLELVAGNHDVMKPASYRDLGIAQVGKELHLGLLALVHDPGDAGVDLEKYYLAGHVHPAVSVPGAVGLTLPALVLGEKLGLLPSFGAFTGTAAVSVEGAVQVLLFSGKRVYALPL